MSILPFIFRATRLSDGTAGVFPKDIPATDDPLPAALEICSQGNVLSNETRLTEVRRETTDDN